MPSSDTDRLGDRRSLKRPLRKMYPLEFGTHEEDVQAMNALVVSPTTGDVRRRQRRAATCKADRKGRLFIDDLTLFENCTTTLKYPTRGGRNVRERGTRELCAKRIKEQDRNVRYTRTETSAVFPVITPS